MKLIQIENRKNWGQSLKGQSPIFSIFWVWLILNLCLGGSLFAITIPELQDGMKKTYLALNSVQFDYEQLATSTLTTEMRVSTGTLYFKKPRFVRIEQKSPEIQFIIANGKEVTLYTPRFHQAMIEPWDRWANGNLLLMCLSGSLESLKTLEMEYEWTIVGDAILEKVPTWVVHLSPLNDKINLSLIRIWISQENYTIRKVEWARESLKVETTLNLFQKNPELKKDLFQFKKDSNDELFYME